MTFLAAAVFQAAVMCCCFENIALAKTTKPSCHEHMSGSDAPGQAAPLSDANHKAQCDCHKDAGLLAQPTFEIKSPVIFVAGGFHVLPAESYFSTIFSNNTPLLSASFQGPPRKDSSVPLYLKNSVLRI